MKINKIALLHVIIILAIYAMPFWLDWRLIIVYSILNQLQVRLLGGCIIFRNFNSKTNMKDFIGII